MEDKLRVRKLKNGKGVSKDEVTREMIKGGMKGWCTGFRGCVIWPIRMLCQKTEGLLRLFQCERVKERGWNVEHD